MARERKGAVKRSSVIQSPTHDRCVIRRPVFIGTLRLVSHLDLMARPRCTVARMFRGGGEKSGGDSEEAMKERKTERLVHALWMENVKIEYVSLVAG